MASRSPEGAEPASAALARTRCECECECVCVCVCVCGGGVGGCRAVAGGVGGRVRVCLCVGGGVEGAGKGASGHTARPAPSRCAAPPGEGRGGPRPGAPAMEAVRRRCGPTAAAFALCVLVGALAFLPRRVRSDTGVGDRAYQAQPTRDSASAARRVPFYDELERRGGEASVRVYAQPLDSARLGRDVDAPLEQTRLLPELFLLGGAKCASTFMFDCINSGIFDVNSACGPDVSKWKDCVPKDGKRYIVTSLGQVRALERAWARARPIAIAPRRRSR